MQRLDCPIVMTIAAMLFALACGAPEPQDSESAASPSAKPAPADPAPSAEPTPEALAAQRPLGGSGEIELSMSNAGRPFTDVLTGGQPTDADLTSLAEQGFKTVVNLRGLLEDGVAAERATVEALGMRYISLPIEDAEDLTEENALELHQLLEDISIRPLLLHCGSSNRVGALVALAAFYGDDLSSEEAMARGIAAGLSRLGGPVQQQMASREETSGPPLH